MNIWFSVFDKNYSGFSDLVFEEASVSDDRQEVFDESSDEDVGISSCTDDNNSQGQQDELGTSTNFLAVRKGSQI